MKLIYEDLSHRMQSVMKNVSDRTRAIYTKNEIELSWSIGLDADYDEN